MHKVQKHKTKDDVTKALKLIIIRIIKLEFSGNTKV